MNTQRSGVPPGVNEQQFRRAMERMRQASNTANVSSLAASSSMGMSAMHSSALQSDLAKKYNLPGAARNTHSVVRASAKKSNRSTEAKSTTASARSPSPGAISNGVSTTVAVSTSASSSSSFSRNVVSSNYSGGTETIADGPPVVCGSCDFDSGPGTTICECCGYFLTSARQQNMTMAQKMGISEGPKRIAIVLFDEWDAIEERAGVRNEAYCPICMVGFNQGTEVLLSCSHIFHRACILSFEKYTQQKERLCPICRSQDYQKRLTHKGSQAFKVVCAAKMQALCRGYLCRKQFRSKLRHFYRDGKGEGTLQRRRFYEHELSSFANEISKDVDKRTHEVDDMISSMDNTLLESRQLDAVFASVLQQRELLSAYSTYAVDATDTSFENSANRLSSNQPSRPNAVAQAKSDNSTPRFNWQDILATAMERGWHECPICMGPNLPPIANSMATSAGNSNRQLLILSCTHVFHLHCFENFEKFTVYEEDRSCPVCRQPYQKHTILGSEICLPSQQPKLQSKDIARRMDSGRKK